MITTDSISEFVELTKRRDDLREQLKGVEDARSALEATIAEEWGLNDVQSVKVPGFTVYRQLEQRVNVKGECREQAIQAARSLELEELIAIQPQRFQSWAKEMIANEGGLPSELAPLVNVYEHTSIRCRKS